MYMDFSLRQAGRGQFGINCIRDTVAMINPDHPDPHEPASRKMEL